MFCDGPFLVYAVNVFSTVNAIKKVFSFNETRLLRLDDGKSSRKLSNTLSMSEDARYLHWTITAPYQPVDLYIWLQPRKCSRVLHDNTSVAISLSFAILLTIILHRWFRLDQGHATTAGLIIEATQPLVSSHESAISRSDRDTEIKGGLHPHSVQEH